MEKEFIDNTEMSGKTLNNSDWLDENQSSFDNVERIRHQLKEHCDAYEKINDLIEKEEVTLEVFKTSPFEYLKSVQTVGFDDLIEAGKDTQYEELGKRETELSAKIAKLAIDIISVEEQERSKLHAELEKVMECVPGFTNLGRVALDSIKPMIDYKKQDLEAEKAELEEEYESLNEIYLTACEPWPIPQMVPAEDRIKYYTPIETEETIVCVYPADQTAETIESYGRDHKKHPKGYSKLASASEKLATSLADGAGESFTYEELADIMYGSNGPSEQARVRTLLNLNSKGIINIMKDTLASRGLELKWGNKSIIEGEKARRGHRPKKVFRAVPINRENG